MKLRSHSLSPFVVRGIATICAAVFVAGAASITLAAGVIGTGTAASCTDAALNTALAGGGLVTFDCGSGATTITVTSTKTIGADTTIDGRSLVTISGGHTVGVFSVPPGVTFTVQNLTIAHGNSGDAAGGIANVGGTLTVTNSTFSGNGGAIGGIFNGAGGALTVTNSSFSGNTGVFGAGIGNITGTATVTNSTFSGNRAGHSIDGGGNNGVGGGIYNSDTLTVTTSTFSGNSAAVGGGIFNSYMLTVANSTFSGNSAGHFDGPGGGIYNDGTVTVTNSTFSGNSAGGGGGIYGNHGAFFSNDATLTVTNTILSNSTAGGNCAGSVIDGGHNIDDGTTCGFTGTGCASPSGSSFCSTNPRLDPAGLTDPGGSTASIALQADSPAINAGNQAVCTAPPVDNRDQRGDVRPGTGATRCSIGAYEYNAVPPPPTTCVGDCNGDGQVIVTALITMVNIALGTSPVSACAAGDANGDGTITINQIIQAVNNALNGCGGA